VHEAIYEKFTELFLEQVRTTSKVGDPYDTDTFQGPQVSKAQYDRVLSYVEKGKAEGATLSLGGKPADVAGEKGFFIEPTVFTNVRDSMAIYREEIFGPFAVLTPFSTEEEAIRRANDTTYGLGAAIFTQDITRALKLGKKIEAGSKFTTLPEMMGIFIR
jgi:aldehyde dehydrogenase (NAD(P)+)